MMNYQLVTEPVWWVVRLFKTLLNSQSDGGRSRILFVQAFGILKIVDLDHY